MLLAKSSRRTRAEHRTAQQPLAVQEPDRQLLVVAGRAHRHRQRAAAHPDLQRLLDGDAVLDPTIPHHGGVHHGPSFYYSMPPATPGGQRGLQPLDRRARRPRSARAPGRPPARGWPRRRSGRAPRAARRAGAPSPCGATRPAARSAPPPARPGPAAPPRACGRGRGPGGRAASAPRRPARRRARPAAPRSAPAGAARGRGARPPARAGPRRASSQWPWATSSPEPVPTRIASACPAAISRTNGSARTTRWACRTRLRTSIATCDLGLQVDASQPRGGVVQVAQRLRADERRDRHRDRRDRGGGLGAAAVALGAARRTARGASWRARRSSRGRGRAPARPRARAGRSARRRGRAPRAAPVGRTGSGTLGRAARPADYFPLDFLKTTRWSSSSASGRRSRTSTGWSAPSGCRSSRGG